MTLVCTGCSLLCDDLVLDDEGHVLGACSHGYRRLKLARSGPRLKSPRLGYRRVDPDRAVRELVRALRSSRRVLVYGLERASDEALRLAVDLAERLNGLLDTRPTLTPRLAWGKVSKHLVTLDEAREEADAVLMVCASPADSYLRLASKFLVFPKGWRIPEGRESRVVAVMDVRRTPAMRMANYRMATLEPWRLLEALRARVEGRPARPPRGVSMRELMMLASDLASSRMTVVALGLDGVREPGALVDEAVGLVEALKDRGVKAGVIPLSETPTGMGLVRELASLGDPRRPLNPGGGEAPPSLAEALGMVDAVLVVASDPVSHLPLALSRRLASRRLVVLDDHETMTSRLASLVVPVAVLGVEEGGQATRTDGVSMRLSVVGEPPEGVLRLADLLEQLVEEV